MPFHKLLLPSWENSYSLGEPVTLLVAWRETRMIRQQHPKKYIAIQTAFRYAMMSFFKGRTPNCSNWDHRVLIRSCSSVSYLRNLALDVILWPDTPDVLYFFYMSIWERAHRKHSERVLKLKNPSLVTVQHSVHHIQKGLIWYFPATERGSLL